MILDWISESATLILFMKMSVYHHYRLDPDLDLVKKHQSKSHEHLTLIVCIDIDMNSPFKALKTSLFCSILYYYYSNIVSSQL